MIRLRSDPAQVDPSYLATVLRSETGHRQLKSRAKGLAGSMPKIDQGAIAAADIPVPTIDEQQRIIRAVNELHEKEQRLRVSLVIARTRGRALRWALLAAAFSGRLTGHDGDMDQVEELAATFASLTTSH
jgi:type I restriction enzyme S subunit